MVPLQLCRWKFSYEETLHRLHSVELKFYSQNRQICFLSHPLGKLEVTYALFLQFVGKRDFLFVTIEHFSLALIIQMLQAYIGRSQSFSNGWVTLNANFRWKGTLPTNLCWYQKTRVITLLCSIKISSICFFDRQTDRITILKTALAQLLRAVKIHNQFELNF